MLPLCPPTFSNNFRNNFGGQFYGQFCGQLQGKFGWNFRNNFVVKFQGQFVGNFVHHFWVNSKVNSGEDFFRQLLGQFSVQFLCILKYKCVFLHNMFQFLNTVSCHLINRLIHISLQKCKSWHSSDIILPLCPPILPIWHICFQKYNIWHWIEKSSNLTGNNVTIVAVIGIEFNNYQLISSFCKGSFDIKKAVYFSAR